MKAFGAWQKRNAVDEIEKRKNLHVSALQGVTEWKEAGDQEEAIESVENYYELLKDIVWDPKKADRENKEMKALEDADPFLRAGKRNLERITPAKMPNEDNILDSLE